jgi:hypothetical protein
MVVVQSPRCPRMMVRRTIYLILALSFAAFTAFAGVPPLLSANINELAPRSRSAAPEWIEVLLTSRSTTIREGSLEFTMTEWGQQVYRYRTHEVVINTGDQRFRFLLPAATSSGAKTDRTLQLSLIEKAGATHLGSFPLLARQMDARSHVIAVIRPSYRNVGSELHPVWQALRLERLAPEEGPSFDTTPIFFEPADVPVEPLGFFAFDLVLIESGAYKGMREKARTALVQWVNAGGSLCVMADEGVDADQVDAINAMAGTDPQWKPLTLDASGRVDVPGGLSLSRMNFGRLAVATELPMDETEVSPAWRRTCAFLWRMRSDQAKNVEAEGKWNLPKGQRGWDLRLKVSNPSLQVLMPSSVRVLPLWVLATLIGLLIILVGPGDWFLLGALKRHRYTWLLFPSVAALITGATLYSIQKFMGGSARQRSLIISDIGVSGRVIRETRIELELPAREGRAVISSTNALRLPLAPRHDNDWPDQMSAWTNIEFRGQYPARYDYIRPQRQWTPQLTRITTIGDLPDTSGIRWQAFDSERIAGVWSGVIAPDLSPGSPCSFDFFVRGKVRCTDDRPVPSSWRREITAVETEDTKVVEAKVTRVLLTQESPSGFADLADLPIIETTDTSRTVFVAAKNEGNDIHIWRRLYLH